MEQKIEFICEWEMGNYTITELCRKEITGFSSKNASIYKKSSLNYIETK